MLSSQISSITRGKKSRQILGLCLVGHGRRTFSFKCTHPEGQLLFSCIFYFDCDVRIRWQLGKLQVPTFWNLLLFRNEVPALSWMGGGCLNTNFSRRMRTVMPRPGRDAADGAIKCARWMLYSLFSTLTWRPGSTGQSCPHISNTCSEIHLHSLRKHRVRHLQS